MLPAATPSPCQTLHFVANAKTGGVSANHTQPRCFSASGLHLSPGADGVGGWGPPRDRRLANAPPLQLFNGAVANGSIMFF